MNKLLTPEREERPVVAVLWIDDPDYDPAGDEFAIEGAKKGVRPIQMNASPSGSLIYNPRSDAGRWIPNYLRALREGCGKFQAATAAGVRTETVRLWRIASDDFNRMCEEAQGLKVDMLENKLYTRAMKMENMVGTVAGMFLLKKERPEYRENAPVGNMRIEHTGPGGGPIQVEQKIVRIYIPHNGRDAIETVEGEFREVKTLGDGSEDA